MDEQEQVRQPEPASDEEAPTRQEIDEALQAAMRREAATREEMPDTDQVFDSANREGMGGHRTGEGRRTGRQS